MQSRTLESLDELLGNDLDHVCDHLRLEFARMAGKNLLITGGAGFLGYYLIQSVLHWNRSAHRASRIALTVADNYARGVPQWMTGLEGTENLTLLRHDVTRPLPPEAGDFQYVIHAAGIASPIHYRKRPIQTMDANIDGLRHLLDRALEQTRRGVPVEGFLFYSSSEIYGDPPADRIPTPEDYRGNVSCTGPRACYDESKRYGETLCVNFAGQYGIPTRMARPFNNYGPGLKISDRRVIPDFARDVLAGRDIVMHSDGSPQRTFCYVADAVVGYYRVLVRGRDGEPYNIGSPGPEISMRDLAQKVVDHGRDLFDYRGRVVHRAAEDEAYLVDNPNRRCPDLTKSRRELGYEPSVSLDEGLRRSLVWYHHNREAEDA
jgi:nucleoside-diphosphate-sugar epimerase